MGEGSKRSYGFGLSRDGHIAFAAAYIAALVTIGAFGFYRVAPQYLMLFHRVGEQQKAEQQVSFRAHPVPDPAFQRSDSFYPSVAFRRRQEGTVIVRLLVLQNGEVGDVSLVKSSGFPQLDAAALVETGNWRYLPAVRNGAPIPAEVNVVIHFKLAS